MARDYDVIIVGSGAAGLAAAVGAADAGASVLVVESEKRVGGSSRLSGGHSTPPAPRSSAKRACWATPPKRCSSTT